MLDTVSISALSVLGGALTSLVSTWLTQKYLDRRALLDSLDHGFDIIWGSVPVTGAWGIRVPTVHWMAVYGCYGHALMLIVIAGRLEIRCSRATACGGSSCL